MPSRFQPIKDLIRNGRLHDAASNLKNFDVNSFNAIDRRDFYYLSAVTYRYVGNFSAAEHAISDLLALFPKYEMAWQERGHLQLARGEKLDAIEAFNQAVSLNWGLKSSWQMLQTLQLEQGNIQEADWCELFLALLNQLDSQFLKWLYLCFAESAEIQLEAVLTQNRKQKFSLAQSIVLATCLFKAERYDKAEVVLRELLPSGNLLVEYLLANVTAQKQDFYASLELAQGLIRRFPDLIQIRFLYANQLMATDQFEMADDYLQGIVREQPNFEQAWLNLGHMAKTRGRGSDAVRYYQMALKVRNDSGDAYWSLANLKNFEFSDNQLMAMESLIQLELTETDQSALSFALGYAYERRGDYDKSFAFYKQGNQLKNKKTSYTPEYLEREFNSNIKADWCRQQAHTFDQTRSEPTPIFVCGMPRAGSTLLEQVLAAHTQITATFELPYVLSIAKQLNHTAAFKGGEFYMDGLESLDKDNLRQLAEQYLAKVTKLNIDTPYFIDKMPNNFRHIGLIKLMFPNAKIIDIRRNKMACCFSNFKQHYGQGQEFSYSWQNVTHYYDKYVELMSFWQKTFEKQLLEVHYEQLVNEPERIIREVMDYLDLEFESVCLRHQDSAKKVKTASAEQVREAIHNRGVDHWRRYESLLKKL